MQNAQVNKPKQLFAYCFCYSILYINIFIHTKEKQVCTMHYIFYPNKDVCQCTLAHLLIELR